MKKLSIVPPFLITAIISLFSLVIPMLLVPVTVEAATCPAGYTCTPTSALPNITSFTANPPIVMSGQSTTLSWTSVNTTFCWGAGMGPAKTFPPNYSVVRPLLTTSSTNYTLTCSGTSTPAQADVETLTVQALPSVANCASGYICSSNSAVSTTTSATISLDPSSPPTSSVPVTNTTQDQYLGLPVLIFDVNAQGGPVTLKSLDVSFSTSATSSGLITAAYLYQGSTEIASAAISYVPGAVANFGVLSQPITIPAGSSLPLTVKVDVSNVSGTGLTVAANINPIAVGLYGSNGASITLGNTGVQGNSITPCSDWSFHQSRGNSCDYQDCYHE